MRHVKRTGALLGCALLLVSCTSKPPKSLVTPLPQAKPLQQTNEPKKRQPSDEGRQGQAALIALATYSELKNIILVDEDVDIFDSDDILWAMTTRMQGDVSITHLPGIRGHQLDPSQAPDYSPSIRGNGITCKTIFDCTVPWALKSRFERAPFMEVDPTPWAPELFKK